MIHADHKCLNPITGRRVWLVRYIPVGEYGDDWDWILFLTKEHWFSKTVLIEGLKVFGGRFTQRRELTEKVKSMGFTRGLAWIKGRWVEFK